MERSELLSRLEAVFASALGKENVELKEEFTAADVDGWDSLTHVTIISKIEEEFNMKFAIREMLKWKNVGKMLDTIQAKLG